MREKIYGLDFEINSSTIVNNEKVINLIPNPDSTTIYEKSLEVLDEDSLKLLWSKNFFGINHNTQMFQVMYDTFVDKLIDVKNIDDTLTVHALFCDLIIRFGAIIEDFAGFCSSCYRHVLESTSLAEHFVAFGYPKEFYIKMLSDQSEAYLQPGFEATQTKDEVDMRIRQIFRIPQTKEELDTIFIDLTDTEKELIWKGISSTTSILSDRMEWIAENIVSKHPSNFTLFDTYNKLKHGFAPFYSYLYPSPLDLATTDIQSSDEAIVESFIKDSMLIMHNKLPVQMTEVEKLRSKNQKLGTITTTRIEVTKEKADQILNTVKAIDYLYKNLVKRYLAYSQGINRIQFLGSSEYLTTEESDAIISILDDDSRYA
ncbi:hypothetical protein OB236_13965 [Paenibacillus sp. WQ 127069]|uniref:Uncharacterized protein n=1 Tax=Paenibacillus baimaensis TaxID=2982185 RepID=A0ABT2UF02_9BACL|nr:hypothetical protein [Paenibacillus sp. WQ 127069]MCU6793223.1 hypothetical protein [Paenibacillus sp. WQ 127069]